VSNTSTNNKRIAKNTLLLYIRLFVTMIIGLFTSRIVLQTLGIEDYGVYNVVAGFVAMFSLFTSSLSSAISRYLTYNLGKGDKDTLSRVFSTSMNIMVCTAFLFIVIGELLGIWFLNAHLNIPEDRMYAANWVFQLTLLTFATNLINVPNNSTIIAHERMDFFAYVSIFEVVMKLVIVYMLYVSPFDKLITYAFLYWLVAILILCIYSFYCKKNFNECRYHKVFDKDLLKEMSGFAGWNLLGSGTYIFNTQGVNILTNMFFNVASNAARGVANTVEGIAKHFVQNFTTAINPQITKSYAEGNFPYLYSLVCRGSKFSYILMLFFFVPFMFETETIMKLWLGEYPLEAPVFLRLSMIGTMFDLLGNSTANAAWATGDIKKYYIIVGGLGMAVFPLTWVVFAMGFPAYTAYIVFALIYAVIMVVKVYIIKGLVGFPPRLFLMSVILPILVTTITSFIVPAIVFYSMDGSIIRTIVVSAVSIVSVAICTYYTGLTAQEKNFALSQMKRFIPFLESNTK